MQREPPKTLLLRHRSICHLLCVNYRANCKHQIDAIIQNGTIGCSGYLVWSFCLQHFVVVVAKIACACQACNILIANKYHKISQQKLVFARPLKSRYVNVIDIPRKWPATACCAIKNCTFCCCCCCCMIERAELERVGRADPLRTLDTFVLYINIYGSVCRAGLAHTIRAPSFASAQGGPRSRYRWNWKSLNFLFFAFLCV